MRPQGHGLWETLPVIFRRRSPTGNPDPVAFMERLGRVVLDDRYTEVDRYRDFRRVFLDSQEGRRVLAQIMGATHLYMPSFDPENPDSKIIYVHEGERNIGLFVLSILNADPNDLQENQYGDTNV